MKEITMQEAIAMPYIMIDMVTPVKGYERYDFHRGTRCKINGYPFELMAENGELSLEAGMIALTAHKQKVVEVPKFKGGQTIAIVELYHGYAKAYLITLPEKVRQQSIVIK